MKVSRDGTLRSDWLEHLRANLPATLFLSTRHTKSQMSATDATATASAAVQAIIEAASTLTIEQATSTVLLPGEKMPDGTPTVRG